MSSFEACAPRGRRTAHQNLAQPNSLAQGWDAEHHNFRLDMRAEVVPRGMDLEYFSSFEMGEVQADPPSVGLEETRREGLQILGCRTAAINVEDGEQFGES